MIDTLAANPSVVPLAPAAAMGNPGELSFEIVCAYNIEICRDHVLLNLGGKTVIWDEVRRQACASTESQSSLAVSTSLSNPSSDSAWTASSLSRGCIRKLGPAEYDWKNLKWSHITILCNVIVCKQEMKTNNSAYQCL
jgi:hypothetical protein